MLLVRVGTLPRKAIFLTTLTLRTGIVVGEIKDGGVPAYLEPIQGDAFEEKTLAPEIIVAIEEEPRAVFMPLPLAATAA